MARFQSQRSSEFLEKRAQLFNNECLRSCPGLEGASEQFLSELFAGLSVVLFRPEELIVKEGDVADKVFFLCRGEVNVYLEGLTEADPKHALATIADSAIFGELGPLMKGRRKASVQAVSYCDCRWLSEEAFTALLSRYPAERAKLEQLAQDRLKTLRLAKLQLQPRQGAGDPLGGGDTRRSLMAEMLLSPPRSPKRGRRPSLLQKASTIDLGSASFQRQVSEPPMRLPPLQKTGGTQQADEAHVPYAPKGEKHSTIDPGASFQRQVSEPCPRLPTLQEQDTANTGGSKQADKALAPHNALVRRAPKGEKKLKRLPSVLQKTSTIDMESEPCARLSPVQEQGQVNAEPRATHKPEISRDETSQTTTPMSSSLPASRAGSYNASEGDMEAWLFPKSPDGARGHVVTTLSFHSARPLTRGFRDGRPATIHAWASPSHSPRSSEPDFLRAAGRSCSSSPRAASPRNTGNRGLLPELRACGKQRPQFPKAIKCASRFMTG